MKSLHLAHLDPPARELLPSAVPAIVSAGTVRPLFVPGISPAKNRLVVRSGYGVVYAPDGEVIEDAGVSIRDFLIAKHSRPESGMAIALWLQQLARDLGHEGKAFGPFVRDLGEAFTLARFKKAVGLPVDEAVVEEEVAAYFAERLAAAAGGEHSKLEALAAAIDEQLRDPRCLSSIDRLYIVGGAPDGTLTGLVAR